MTWTYKACYQDPNHDYLPFRASAAVLGSGTYGGPEGVAGASNPADCQAYADGVGFNVVGVTYKGQCWFGYKNTACPTASGTSQYCARYVHHD